jgi:hypothetical protein
MVEAQSKPWLILAFSAECQYQLGLALAYLERRASEEAVPVSSFPRC